MTGPYTHADLARLAQKAGATVIAVTGPDIAEPSPIDAAVEQVVKASSDRDALTEAVRALAGELGYGLVAKTLPALHEGDRVRLLNDHPGLKAGALGDVVSFLGDIGDVQFDGQPYPMLYGRRHLEIVAEQGDERGYETDATPKPRHGDHGTCGVCGGAVAYIGKAVWNGFETDVIDMWAHDERPADGHDAELGGPA